MPSQEATAARKLAKAADTPASMLAELAGQSDSVDRLLAAHPNADAALLEKFSHSSDKATRKAVVLNPNAPKDVLVRLAPQFPGDFFKNPVFDWLLVEQPDLLTQIGGGVLKNILKRPECPESFLRWAARHGDSEEKKAVAMNPNAPKEALQLLAVDEKSAAAAAAKQHIGLASSTETDPDATFLKGLRHALIALEPEDCGRHDTMGQVSNVFFERYIGLNHLLLYSKDLANQALGHRYFREQLESSGAVSEWPIFRQKLSRVTSEEKAAVATHDLLWMPPAKAAKAPKHALPVIRALGLSQPTAEVEQLIKNHKHVDWLVRAAVARHLYTPESVLTTLATDAHQTVRALAERNLARVAQSRAGSDEKIEKLGKTAPALRPFLDEVAKRLGRARSPGDYSLTATPVAVATHYSGKLRWEALAGGQWDEIFTDNPTVPEQALEEMARDAHADVRLAVAARPNAPVRILEGLAKDKTFAVREAVARHPGCPDELLKALSRDKRPEVRRAVAERTSCPPEVLETLTDDEDWSVRYSLASNLSSSTSILEALARGQDDSAQAEVAKNPSCPVHVLDILAKDDCDFVRSAVGEHPACSIQTLEMLATDDTNYVRKAVARSPNCPTGLLESLANDQEKSVRLAVAASVNCPTSLLEVLAKDGDSDARKAVAQHRASPDAIIELLARDKDPSVRAAVARRDECSDTTLAVLSADGEEDVRLAIAKHPACPTSVVERLASDKAREVRAAVAQRADCPKHILAALAGDADATVREWVARHTGCPSHSLEALAKDTSPFDPSWGFSESVASSVADNPACPANVLELLASSRVWVRREIPRGWQMREARQVMGEHPACPAHLLEALSHDSDAVARCYVARNPTCPVRLLEALADDDEWRVRAAVMNHLSTPEEVRRRIEEQHRERLRQALAIVQTPLQPLEWDDLQLDKVLNHSGDILVSLLCPECDKKALAKGAKSKDPFERFAAALNPSLPKSVVMRLLDDPDPAVQQAAAAHPAVAK